MAAQHELPDNETAPNPSSPWRKLGVATAGGATIAAGVVLIPLPGPGTLVVLAGLGILAQEFPAARRTLDRAKGAARNVVDRARTRREEPGAE